MFENKSRAGWAPEWILLAASACMLLLGNRHFVAQALVGRSGAELSSWVFGGALVLALLAINFLVLSLFAWGRLFRPVIVLALLVTAGAAHFIDSFGIVIDPSMLRNALRTHWGEASELLGLRLAGALLLAALPAWWLLRRPPVARSWPRAVALRLGAIGLALLALGAALWMAFQPLASLMRNQRELRYLVTPANVLWSATALARDASRAPAGPLRAVGRDAAPGPTLAGTPRPRVVVLVVGETARAANWGLNGYARDTTPELARLPLVRFPDATSCGTDTETSLPCMFAAVGRRQYDERRIRGSENLLHVLRQAGVGVHWRDNQSGCKGVCDGFAQDTVAALAPPGACSGGHCLDEGLLHGLEELLPRAGGPALPVSRSVAAGPVASATPGHDAGARFVVLHQIGNHGPAYHRRVPAAFKVYQPACEEDDLRRCDAQSIVNAYDNALRYTDHVLATLIARLQARAGEIDSAVIYVSDHGESLGEHGLFLHGMPYAIAPEVQKRVPMLMWLSSGFATARGLDTKCLGRRAAAGGVRHDHLFHSVLGLFDVHTAAREAEWDLTHGCTRASPTQLARAAG